MSMYRQLWLAIIASTLLSMGGALFASLLSARGYLESQLSIKNTDNATALALSLSQSNPDPVMADLVVASLFDGGHYELIRITDPKGNLITERTAPADDLDAPGWFVKALPLQASAGTAQVSSGWKQFGTVTLVSHSRFVYGALWKSAYEMVLALSLAGLVGGYLAALVLRRLRVPLNAVIDQAEAITQRRFVSIELPAVPELRQLAVAMNATVGRLKAMFEEEAGRLETVRREANFDALTGLANRTHFMARLRQSLESEDSLGGSLLLIRLPDLVGINRRLGRGATDDFLRQVGGVVDACAAQSPFNVAARLNGADFAVLLGHGEEARVAADDLLAALVEVATPFVGSDVTGWIALGRFKQGTDMGTLLARVDMALAGVEAEGANAVREMPMDEVEELPRTAQQWSVMIQRALEQGWVRLISFPVVDAQGQLSHRECPLRLMFEEKGKWLPAGRFLPAAERLKLTPALDLAAVALGLKELQAKPLLKGLAINLSASSVGEVGFRKALMTLLTGQREVTSRLWLEVAEAGVGLEHYGHQFSQIGLLHDMGLDFLKVDSSFVRGVDSNAGNVAFLKGLCSIAHNIGLQVLAEGVATQAEWVTLIRLGFDGATGPLIQEPPQ
jgi:predicted signal transduction protein with EAL and GGDEF domain